MKRKNKIGRNLGCTIATLTINDKIFFCNNEDYKRPEDGTFILFVPQQEIPKNWNLPKSNGTNKIYGFSLVGSKFDDGLYPQGGINSEGLCYDINALPATSLKKNEGKTWLSATNFFDLLWTNKSVDDVINWFKTHKFPYDNFSFQIHVADAFGDAVVIGANEDAEMVFTKKGDKEYLISTNFNIVNPENHFDYPCKRYSKALEIAERLVKKKDLTVGDCIEILKATHIEYKKETGTLYSNIFDLVKKKILLFHIGNFKRRIEFDLKNELEFKDDLNEADQYKIADSAKFQRLNFEGMRVYTISKLFNKL